MTTLDAKLLSVGDVFYGVKNTINAYNRKKIHREIDGELWFKYDQPPASYSLITYTVLGVLEKTLIGEWPANSEYELLREIYVAAEVDGKVSKYETYVDDLGVDKYFLSKDEAMEYIDVMYAKDMELDRK